MNGFGTIDKKDINVLISSIENKINFIRNDISQNVTSLKNQLNACNEELNRLKKLVIQVTDYSDIQFLRIRGMNYRFGYYTINEETGIKEWNEQSLRKWANQTMTFTIRTRYVTEDTLDINGNDPEAKNP